jgi:hypothetical protein
MLPSALPHNISLYISIIPIHASLILAIVRKGWSPILNSLASFRRVILKEKGDTDYPKGTYLNCD